MRKNQGDRTGVRAVLTTYEIKGLNLDRFINTVKKRGIALYDVKKYGNKRLIASVSLKERQKFFAIAKELCYNIKKVREKGAAYPLLKLYRSVGLIVGALILTLSAHYFDGVIFSFSYSGSGSVYKREVEEYLYSRGIKKFTRFSSFDLNAVEDEILAANPHLSFASCQKVGSVLKIELALSQDKVDRLSGNVSELRADESGVIESVKVYRGTAAVKVGQTVDKGDLLVDGVMVIKEQTVKTNVLACVSLVCEKTYLYRSGVEGEEEKALLLAEQQYSYVTATDSDVAVQKLGEEYIYTVTLKYRRVLHAG